MAFDVFSTQNLTTVVNDLDRPALFVLNTWFGAVENHTTEEIWFDVLDRKPRITPFVHPDVPATAVDQTGYVAKSYKPAYVKDLRHFKGNAPLKRLPGEPFGGNLSPAQRIERLVTQNLEDQLEMHDRRLEVMCVEALRTGNVTVVGEDYPSVVIDFQRDPALTVVLSGNDTWDDQANSSPLTDLRNWASLTLSNSSVATRTLVCEPTAAAAFLDHPDVQAKLETRRGSMSTAETAPMARGTGVEKALYHGYIGNFDIWEYQDEYTDPITNATTQMMPPGQVLLLPNPGNDGLMGRQAFGVVQDDDANYSSPQFFAKSWVEPNPGRRNMLLQSAPLTIPYRPNASLGATVL